MSKNALISVSNKDGIIDFAKNLISLGYKIISTGGTYQLLKENNVDAIEVSEHTGFPEIMDGRIKTLHPKIHAGILSRRKIDKKIIKEHSIDEIDIVVVNLYPFYSTAKDLNSTEAEIIEKIDIGGPTMLRAAAKNHEHVTTIVDPNDYDLVTKELKKSKTISKSLKKQLAIKVFSHTANYDLEISNYFNGDQFEENLLLSYEKTKNLRYGENPHQTASFFKHKFSKPYGISSSILHQGKEMSYNNIADTDTAIDCVCNFVEPTCVIVKHANPCGVSSRKNLLDAYQSAFESDPTSAFGGIIAFNKKVSGEVAQRLIDNQFLEVVAAPAYSDESLKIFTAKPNVRVLSFEPKINDKNKILSVSGGLLVQSADNKIITEDNLEVVTKKVPSKDEIQNALFAWKVCKYVKSNAIVFAADEQTLGIGAGQMSRIDSGKIAASKAKEFGFSLNGASMASDAFFPFRDNVDNAHELGIKCIIQPGGSIKDEEVIQAANGANMSMLFTKVRHFRH
mgnify:FL=1